MNASRPIPLFAAPSVRRASAAREALALCANADVVAAHAADALGVDDDRLFALLEQREQMLVDLAEHIVALKLERPTADNPLLAASARIVDDADQLITSVCEALSACHRTTIALAMRVEERVAELRAELATVQRAGNAGLGYSAIGAPRHVDRIR